MSTHATAQLIGTRTHQCDATATRAIRDVRAFVLLDGIGSTDEIRDWTRATARRLARTAATIGDAEAALRRVHAAVAADPKRGDPWNDTPSAVAVVAVTAPDGKLTVAWCGDARAYLYADGEARRLTTDHNMRQELLDQGFTPGRYARNTVTSYLGDLHPDAPIGAVTVPAAGRLLLASDGAYEPIEDDGRDVGSWLTAPTPGACARSLVTAAIGEGLGHCDNATVLIADVDAPGSIR